MESPQNHKKRGQVALENLILYSMVILVIIVILILLWNLQVFKPFGGKKGFVGFSQIIPQDWVVGSNKAYLSLINQGESPLIIGIDQINVTIGLVQCRLAPDTPETIEPADVWVVELACPNLGNKFEIGDYFDGDITIDYSNLASVVAHQSVGKIYGHIEELETFTPTTRTTTTRTVPPRCFHKECNETGELDVENCGEIVYRDRADQCIYCPVSLNPDGIRACWYNGACSNRCFFDRDCDPDDPLNLCDKCVSGVCQELDSSPPQCGPCPTADWMTLTSRWCNMTLCPYCDREWVAFSSIPSDGEYQYFCEPGGECGNECINWGRDLYDICYVPTAIDDDDNPCPHCEPLPANISIGQCTQGDCGNNCGVTGLDECIEGCRWCNNTGPTPSYKCELGDCGRACADSTTCNLGCDVCYNNRCIKDDIGIGLIVHNETYGKVVSQTDPIYLNATAYAIDGIDKIIVSNSLFLTPGYNNAREACNQIRIDVNMFFQSNGYPDPENPATIATLNGLFGITGWPFSDLCFGSTNCRRGWTTSEAALGSYCYVAIAKKTGTPERWSLVDTDYIQVGLIDVYLVWPPPEP